MEVPEESRDLVLPVRTFLDPLNHGPNDAKLIYERLINAPLQP
jgi:hypothetical protein